VGRGIRRPPVRARQRRPTHGIESEAALRAANDKFRRRFRSVERQAAEQGVALRDLDFEALDDLWHVAKAEERESRAMSTPPLMIVSGSSRVRTAAPLNHALYAGSVGVPYFFDGAPTPWTASTSTSSR
jgi:hypothetical protein